MKFKRTSTFVMYLVALALLLAACSSVAPQSAATADAVATNASVNVTTAVIPVTATPANTTTAAVTTATVTIPTVTSTKIPTTATTEKKPSTTIVKQEVTSTMSATPTTATTTSKTEPAWKAHPEQYKLIVLTFDDAPGDATVAIVDTIASYEGAGTLFIQGNVLERTSNYGAVQHALDNGFELGNHTYSHPYLAKISATEILDEIRRTQALVKDGFGITMNYLRPGYLATNDVVLNCAKACNMAVVHGHWNSITQQYRSLEKETVEATVSACLQEAYDGAIFLMHSTNWTTANALDTVCSKLYNQGYRFVTLSELFAMKGITDIPNEPIDDINQLLG